MISRYNPHALARAAREWAAEPGIGLPTGDLTRDLADRARAWTAPCPWTDPARVPLPLDPAWVAEYGIDAARLALLAAGAEGPGLPLLESAHRWLAGFHEAMLSAAGSGGAAGSGAEPWSVDPWLVAAGEAVDHGPGRGRWYPALAAIRKAWKQAPVALASPLGSETVGKGPEAPPPRAPAGKRFGAAPPAGRELILALVAPFAPVLGRWLLEQEGVRTTPARGSGTPPGGKPAAKWAGSRPLATLVAAFPTRRALRLALDNGGWAWVVVDAAAFAADPGSVVAAVPWIARVAVGRSWRLEERPEGWKVCLNRPMANAGSSRS